MSGKARYERGEGFTDVYDLIRWVLGGGRVYWNDLAVRPLAPDFMVGQRLMTLKAIAPHALKAVVREGVTA
jgi:hypothetical protein